MPKKKSEEVEKKKKKSKDVETKKRKKKTEEPETKKRGKKSKKSEDQPNVFDPYAAIDEELDSIEKKFGMTSSMLDKNEQRISTGLLILDIILGGGLCAGGWYTAYGPEQSCKSTTTMTILASLLRAQVRVASVHDYEGSSSPDYIENIMRGMGIKGDITQVFGQKDEETGEWIVKPRVRYYAPSNGEKFFDYLNRLERTLPDKVKVGDKYYLLYEHTKDNIKKLKGMYDPKYLSKYNKLRVPANDGLPQAVVLVDSYPAMMPKALDSDDPSGAMALQARMFSDGLKRVKGSMRDKRIIVLGVNQLRLRPAVQYGCFHGASRIVMADGTQKPIREVQKGEKVISYNMRTNKVESKKVLRVFENGTTDSWLQFKCSGISTKNGLAQFRCTPNHLLLGADGVMRPASAYKPGDKLMGNSFQSPLTEDQKQIILGSIIGDGYFIGDTNFGIAHNENQLDYLISKKEAFGSKVTCLYARKPYFRSKSNSSISMHCIETIKLRDPWFFEQKEEHRGNIKGQGYILGSLPEKLDLLGTAIWLMDDAGKGKKWFAKTMSLTLAQTKHLIRTLNKRLGLDLSLGYIGNDYGVKAGPLSIRKLSPYIHKQFADSLNRGYNTNLKFGTHKFSKESNTTFGMPVTISSIEISKNMYGKDSSGKAFKDNTKYDLEIEGNHTYCVNGVFVHNSPEYEPCGESLKFYSDCRLRMMPRALPPDVPPKAKEGNIEKEASVEFEGAEDSYRYIHVKAIKNKLSTPYLDGMMRLWITDGENNARGFDPVWDCYQYLIATGQLSGSRKRGIKLKTGTELDKLKLDWLDFKLLIVGSTKQIKEFCSNNKVKAIRLREWCFRQMESGKGIKFFIEKRKEDSKAKSFKQSVEISDDDDD